MRQTNFDREFDQMTTRVDRTFNLAMGGMIVMGLASLAASAAVIYLLYAAAQWLMANA